VISESVLVVAIPAPRERQDELVLSVVAPAMRALTDCAESFIGWFERVNKPDWGLRVHVAGSRDWLEQIARLWLTDRLGLAREAAHFDEGADDKWSGSRAEQRHLRTFHHFDTRACLDALEAERSGRLGSRVRYSLAVVEGLLDTLELRREARLHFYRRSFGWAIESGRWDHEVLEALERMVQQQGEALSSEIERRDPSAIAPWPSETAEVIGRRLLQFVDASLRSPELERVSLALSAARAHSNRLGLHASREAAMRYLVWRVRGGEAVGR
jgi:hypothetical protein